MKQIDLHVHSTISDGTLTPTELAIYAKEKGLSAIALTDHDTIDGIAECQQKGEELGLEVIPGIEFAAEYQNREIHILGYFIDPKNVFLKNKLKSILARRHARNLQMLTQCESLGFIFNEEDKLLLSDPYVVATRAHFANAFFHKGYVETRLEAFEKYLNRGKPCYVSRKRFTPEECIATIHAAGGLAVLAHPLLYHFENEQFEVLLSTLKADGLDGLETLYCTHEHTDVLSLLECCLKYKLLPTGGSDFHGENKPGLDLGTGYGKLAIPYDILESLKHKHS
ncbi:PHP domain-containing protein [Sporanaerobium hydrogeniformans]|uniref:PHP domain-containing protein n=1 Tax=Sporanaerobium hydrogeniformans TaxID=3072179 RepID=UPI0015D4A80C|nr:PHP domain-containing protein [Sporanaerobium hydrogeniformans]